MYNEVLEFRWASIRTFSSMDRYTITAMNGNEMLIKEGGLWADIWTNRDPPPAPNFLEIYLILGLQLGAHDAKFASMCTCNYTNS